jgi:hypothetical protein
MENIYEKIQEHDKEIVKMKNNIQELRDERRNERIKRTHKRSNKRHNKNE